MQDESTKQPKAKKQKRQRRARNQLHVVQEKSGTYYLKGTVRGQLVRESTYTSDYQIADALRVKRETELLNESVHGKRAVSTFRQCVDNYLSQKHGGSNNRYLAALVEKFGDMRVKDMTPRVIKDYADARFDGCAGATKNTAVINPIVTVLRRAAFDQLCDMPALERYDEEYTPVTGAPPEWIAEMLVSCPRPKVKAYIALMTTTGCRGIDAVRLRSEHVDYEAGTAYLPKTKNGAARTLQLIGPVVEMLKAFKHSEKGTVFGFSKTEVGNEAIRKCCVNMGVPYYSGHRVGRHAFAERLLNSGQTLQQTMKAGGWADVSTLSKRYGHLEKSAVDEAVRDAASGVMRGTLKAVKK